MRDVGKEKKENEIHFYVTKNFKKLIFKNRLNKQKFMFKIDIDFSLLKGFISLKRLDE